MTEEFDPLRRSAPELPPGSSDGAPDGGASQPPNRVRRATRTARRSAPFVAGIVATFLALMVYGVVNPPARPLTTRDIDQAVASAPPSQTPAPARSELVYA